MTSALSRWTLGWASNLGPVLPSDRFVIIRGSIVDVGGSPVPRALVRVRTLRSPSFSMEVLLASAPRDIRTGSSGAISSSPQNTLRVPRSTNEETSFVRVEIPCAGADWVFAMPRDIDTVILRDLVDNYMVRNLSGSTAGMVA